MCSLIGIANAVEVGGEVRVVSTNVLNLMSIVIQAMFCCFIVCKTNDIVAPCPSIISEAPPVIMVIHSILY